MHPAPPVQAGSTCRKGPGCWSATARFGQWITEVLDEARVDWRAIDPGNAVPREARVLAADNTESALRTAGILKAGVLVAGTDNDTVNLGVTTLARRLNPDIFVVIRQNHAVDRVLIDAARANLRFVQSDLIVRECLQILKTPMLGDFITRIRDRWQHAGAAGRSS